MKKDWQQRGRELVQKILTPGVTVEEIALQEEIDARFKDKAYGLHEFCEKNNLRVQISRRETIPLPATAPEQAFLAEIDKRNGLTLNIPSLANKDETLYTHTVEEIDLPLFLKDRGLLFYPSDEHHLVVCSRIATKILQPVAERDITTLQDRRNWMKQIEAMNEYRSQNLPLVDGFVARFPLQYERDSKWLDAVAKDPSQLIKQYNALVKVETNKEPYTLPNAHPVFKLMRAFKLILERPTFSTTTVIEKPADTDTTNLAILGEIPAHWIGDIIYPALVERTLLSSEESTTAFFHYWFRKRTKVERTDGLARATTDKEEEMVHRTLLAISELVQKKITEQAILIREALQVAATAINYKTPTDTGSPYR